MSDWFIRPRPLPAPRLRLFCFPYSGAGGQIYVPWARLLPAGVELCAVQPPGRWNRRAEPAFTRMEPLVAACVAAMAPLTDVPFVIFGHSLGALVGYEVARTLTPRHLVVSARSGPQMTIRRQPLAQLDDDDFLAGIASLYGAIPAAVAADAELMALVLPPLRADMTIYENYVPTPGPALRCPLSGFYGTRDATCGERDIAAWSELTALGFHSVPFDGPHLFLQACQAQVLAALEPILL